MNWLTEEQILKFMDHYNYDIRKSHNARWIDQKCTPDVLCIIADCILENLDLLINGVKIFREKCIDVLIADEDKCRENLDKTYWFATEYVPILGYNTVANEIKNNCAEGNEALNNRLKQMVEKNNKPE